MNGNDAHGFREAVISVRNLDAFVDLFESVARWRVLSEHDSAPPLLRAWNLPASASAREVLMGHPGASSGLVRLIQFRGVRQRVARSAGRTWDTGGILDVNTTVRDVQWTFLEMERRGWIGYGEPAEYTLDGMHVWESMMQGPDGVVLMFVEWVNLPDRQYRADGFAPLHNAAIPVRDVEESVDFFVNKLGFKVSFDATWTSREPGMRVLGLPRELAEGSPRRLVLLHPRGGLDATLMLLHASAASGVDYSAHAHPPNLGIIMFRIPMPGLQDYASELVARGVELVVPPTRVTLQPWGETTICSVRSPTGVWIEFFDPPAAS